MIPDWQLPPGVSRGLWEYVHDPDIARQYDDALADTPLLEADLRFVREHCPIPGRLIDLGCGTGRLCLSLARDGYRCLAVDLSGEMLAIVARKAAAAGVEIDRLQANLVELEGVAAGTFDHAVCLFQTLGMIEGSSARRRVVEHAFRVLRPGGTFIVHGHNRWFLAGTSAGRRLLLANAWDAMRGRRAAGDFLMPAHQGIGPMPMHLFTRRELIRLLEQAGFMIREIRPVATTGPLVCPHWLPSLRSYGYLVAATRSEPRLVS